MLGPASLQEFASCLLPVSPGVSLVKQSTTLSLKKGTMQNDNHLTFLPGAAHLCGVKTPDPSESGTAHPKSRWRDSVLSRAAGE